MSVNVVKLKKQAKILADIDINQLNIMLVGPWQSGKTLFLVGLLEAGEKVFYLNTDLGGTGLLTVKNALRKKGKEDLMNNVVALGIDSFEEMCQFLENPTVFFPDFYKFGFTVLFWDGFANFQHYHIGEKVAGIVPERKGGVSEARTEGLQFEQTDWGMIKSATLKSVDRFFRIHNKLDGTVFHKIVTCQPKPVQKKVGDKNEIVEISQPNLSGASQIMMGAAFDVILLTEVKKSITNKDVVTYSYILNADGNNCCKNRGFTLPNTMEADSYKLWMTLLEQSGIKQGAKDKGLIEEN